MDWAASCEDEIVRQYVDGAKTIREMLEYLQEKHGITVTQFKSKFGGLKNLRADEWKAVIKKIHQRQNQGKASDVYLNGRKLDPKRIMREVRRYSKHCNEESLAEKGSCIDLGVDSSNQHRIEIRTPASSKVDPPLQGNVDVSQRLIGNLETRLGQDSDIDALAETTAAGCVLIPEFDLDFMDFDFNTPRMPAKVSRYGIPDSPSNAYHSSLVCLPPGATRVNVAKSVPPSRSQSSLPFRSRTPSVSNMSTAFVSLPPCDVYSWQNSPLLFFWDLPDISSCLPVARATSTLVFENELRTVNWDQTCKRVPRGTKGWLFSHLVDVDPKLEVLQPVADVLEILLRIRKSIAVEDYQVPLNSTSQQSLDQMFATAAYLRSNNIVDDVHLKDFLIWLCDMGLLGQLLRFLQMESANVYAFRASLLRASSWTWQSCQEAFRALLSLDYRICSGRLGGDLLHTIVASNRTDDAELLVSHGADINTVQDIQYPGYGLGTPLCRAICFSAHNTAKYLISAGCDVNKRFKSVGSDSEETALTIAIRKENISIVTDLLNSGAKFDSDLRIQGYSILEFVKIMSPKIYKLLQQKLGPGEIPEVFQLIQEAEKGNRPLSRFLLEHKILNEEVLEQALCQAFKLGNCGAVRTLLKRGIDPNVRRYRLIDDAIEDTPPILLVIVASGGYVDSDLFYLLMKAGAEIDDNTLMRICHSAIDQKYDNIGYMLAEAGYNASLFGPSILESIASDGQIYRSGFFLDIGAPINAYGSNGRSCLQVAAGEDHLPLVQYLIDRGADVNFPASDDGGLTALQGAAQGGYTEVVDYLIDCGADVRAAPAKDRGVTVLEAAAAATAEPLGSFRRRELTKSELIERERELITTFKSLLALGAPINRANGTSGTVLHGLLRTSRFDCVKLVLQAGAQIDDRENSRPMSTPLQVAVAEGDMETIQLLLKHGADINAPAGAEFGRTALQEATSAQEPDPDIIDLLLLRGADANAPPATRGGVTALQGAAIQGDFQTVRKLLARGADVNAAPALEEGRTAVDGAAEHGRMDMIRLLLSVGAKADPVWGFSRAIRLAEDNRHLALADLLREYEITMKFCNTMAESPAQLWRTQGMLLSIYGMEATRGIMEVGLFSLKSQQVNQHNTVRHEGTAKTATCRSLEAAPEKKLAPGMGRY
ncbi:hypothetical protein EG329_011898 [Mollisiaceae sp. DMI_Dod_QoI]|nr:hypothetical protein EG329_011898 [Helotiales sp. DMI_Dod_QoI]